ncbi:MAG: methyltransferase domain-containing protein [Sphingobacteriaceae bacterium]|nr:methyltransferase domain-containing protein [Cytophagaceae bacterium]
MNSTKWYQTFFDGLATLSWQRAVPASLTEAEVDFILQHTALPPDSRILDVPCGFGRHTLALSERGYRVTGVDLSETYILTLSGEIAARNLPVTLIHGDALRTDLGGPYDAVVCMGNSFGYAPYVVMRRFVRRLAAVTKSGGWFVLNTGVLAETLLPHLKTEAAYETGDITMHVRNEYRPLESVLQSELTFVQGDKTEVKTAFHYVFTLAEVTRLLRGAGFDLRAAYGGPDGKPYALGDYAYLLAQRR